MYNIRPTHSVTTIHMKDRRHVAMWRRQFYIHLRCYFIFVFDNISTEILSNYDADRARDGFLTCTKFASLHSVNIHVIIA